MLTQKRKLKIMKKKLVLKEKRKKRVRLKIRRQVDKLRLSVFRSNRYISAQIIDDQKGKTLVFASKKDLKEKKGNKVDQAFALGKLLAEKAKKKKVREVVFDRSSFAYHGRVKALAEGAREGGLKF